MVQLQYIKWFREKEGEIEMTKNEREILLKMKEDAISDYIKGRVATLIDIWESLGFYDNQRGGGVSPLPFKLAVDGHKPV